MSDFSSRLKRLREAKGLTQEQLADLSGIHRSCIARYETREMGITVENASKLATVLNCTIDDLIGRRKQRDTAGVRTTADRPRRTSSGDLPPV